MGERFKDDQQKARESALFAGITEEDIEPLMVCLGCYARHYKKGEYIHLIQGDIRYMGIVLEGSIQMLKEDVWGSKAIISVIKDNEIFGESLSSEHSLASTVSFVAAMDTMVLKLPFERAMHTCSMTCKYHHHLIENMVSLIADRNLRLTEKLEITSRKNLREKILTFLSLESQKKSSKYFTIDMGRLEMAEYLCTDRSALTRELSRMKDAGILDYDRNTFRLL